MKEEIKVNRNCVNAKVQAHILSEPEMRKTGFTDYAEVCETSLKSKTGLCRLCDTLWLRICLGDTADASSNMNCLYSIPRI